MRSSQIAQRLDGKGLGRWFDKIITGPENSMANPKRLSANVRAEIPDLHKREGKNLPTAGGFNGLALRR